MPPRLSVVVPIFNEERTLSTVIHRLHEHCGFAQIIFVDDGSEDGSLRILKGLARPQNVVLTKPNGGKGSAVCHAIPYISGAYTIIHDGDLEYDPSDIPRLLERAERENLPVLYGSRRLMKHEKEYARWIYYVGGNTVSAVTNILFGSSLTDTMTCYKLIRSDLLTSLPLRANDFRFEPEITGLLLKRGISITEIPINYSPRSRDEGKKIGWKDFFRCTGTLLRVRFSSP
jgi:glycosyltransferase involved in cell wall biosynthesis